MVFYWNLWDSESRQVFRTLLNILADLNNTVVWMVSTRLLISKSYYYYYYLFVCYASFSFLLSSHIKRNPSNTCARYMETAVSKLSTSHTSDAKSTRHGNCAANQPEYVLQVTLYRGYGYLQGHVFLCVRCGLVLSGRVSALHSVVAGSISSIHCWWDLIRSNQLSNVP